MAYFSRPSANVAILPLVYIISTVIHYLFHMSSRTVTARTCYSFSMSPAASTCWAYRSSTMNAAFSRRLIRSSLRLSALPTDCHYIQYTLFLFFETVEDKALIIGCWVLCLRLRLLLAALINPRDQINLLETPLPNDPSKLLTDPKAASQRLLSFKVDCRVAD